MIIALNHNHSALERSALCSAIIYYMPLLRSGTIGGDHGYKHIGSSGARQFAQKVTIALFSAQRNLRTRSFCARRVGRVGSEIQLINGELVPDTRFTLTTNQLCDHEIGFSVQRAHLCLVPRAL